MFEQSKPKKVVSPQEPKETVCSLKSIFTFVLCIEKSTSRWVCTWQQIVLVTQGNEKLWNNLIMIKQNYAPKTSWSTFLGYIRSLEHWNVKSGFLSTFFFVILKLLLKRNLHVWKYEQKSSDIVHSCLLVFSIYQTVANCCKVSFFLNCKLQSFQNDNY